MALRDRFLNMLGVETPEVQKTSNSALRSSRDFLRFGNRDRIYPTWSDIKMPDADLYSGYSYAVIQKRGNKVASLAKNNLKTWANPEVVDEYQKKDELVVHPYLKLIEDSGDFTEKQFWKNISIYLDLAGRYYLGVVRNSITPKNPNLPVITTDPAKFIMLNPYEIRRVIDKDGHVAGYIERKKDGRYREWPLYQIIEMRELNPFDPDEKVWAMTDAAKGAVYTINQSGDYTRQSLHGNIDAPGIITTDVLLSDEEFANFRARVTQHQKGEPIFGNGAGAIKWDAMQVDLDKAALLDINEINRTELFAVSGTSKTSLGIEQSGTTRETARVQSEQFVSDTAQPRLEDIVDFLNLDYKKRYPREYKQTGYKIEVESAIGRDYDTEQKAVGLKQTQFQLAMSLIQSGYTTQSAYQFAEGEIDFADLELEKGLDKPQMPEQPQEPDESAPTSPQGSPQDGSGGGNGNPTDEGTPEDLNGLIPHSELMENGGKGSGNFGHAGRPGEIGGSSDGVGAISTKDFYAKADVLDTDAVEKWAIGKWTDYKKKLEEKYTERYPDYEIKIRQERLKGGGSGAGLIDYTVWGVKKEDLNKPNPHSELIENGGKGSGNFGHAGRPGKVGGSSKGKGLYIDSLGTVATIDKMSDEVEELGSLAYRAIKDDAFDDDYLEGSKVLEELKTDFEEMRDTLASDDTDGFQQYIYEIDKKEPILAGVVDRLFSWSTGNEEMEDHALKLMDLQDRFWEDYEKLIERTEENYGIKFKNSMEGEKSHPLEKLDNGGKGSGNFGHAGREGKVGGSAPRGTGGSIKEEAKKRDIFIFRAEEKFFAKHPEQTKEIFKCVDNFRKMGLELPFTLTTNPMLGADSLEEFELTPKLLGRTLTVDESYTKIYINKNRFKEGVGSKNSYKDGERDYVVNDTLKGVMNHELGHLYTTQLWIRESGHKGEIHDDTSYRNFNRKLLNNSGAKPPSPWGTNNRGKWSTYAEYNSCEAIAEAFANPDYSEDTRKVYDFVRKYKPGSVKNSNAVEKEVGYVGCVGYPESEEVLERLLQAKHENGCTCEHDHKVETYINSLNEKEAVKTEYDVFLKEIRKIEKETINASIEKLTINSFDENDIIGKVKKKNLIKKLRNAIRKYWWLLFPMFASNFISERNKEFEKNVSFVFNNELQDSVNDNAEKVAEGHMSTILNDVLSAANRAYSGIMEESAAELIIQAYKMTPDKLEAYFTHEPTMAEALSSIRRTDILEKNRKIYEKANKMAFEGHRREDIIKAIREEYDDISKNRATLIAQNETSRAFTRSQYEADRQFLNNIGRLDRAYKVWYSRRPANEQDKICDFCNEMIRRSNENPVPFEEPFLAYGNSMEVYGDDGKLKIFKANYEDIDGGTLHPRCQCGYKLVFKNSAGEFVKTLNGGKGSGNHDHAGRPGEVGGSAPRGSNKGEASKNPVKVFSELQKITNWSDRELDYALPYFGSFDNTKKVQEYLKTGEDTPISDILWASDCARSIKDKIAKTTLPEDTDLYRGMMIKWDQIQQVEQNGFLSKGLQSTSLVEDEALRVLGEYKGNSDYNKERYYPVLLKINAKKGGHFAASWTDAEHEIVLPDNIKFKVIKPFIKYLPNGDSIRAYEVEYGE